MAYSKQTPILEEMEAWLETLSFDLQKVLLWVHLVNVPLEAFNKTGLSYIASAIGVPLYMDRVTANQQRLAYAKICVEVDALKEIPKVINVELREGRVIQIQGIGKVSSSSSGNSVSFAANSGNAVNSVTISGSSVDQEVMSTNRFTSLSDHVDDLPLNNDAKGKQVVVEQQVVEQQIVHHKQYFSEDDACEDLDSFIHKDPDIVVERRPRKSTMNVQKLVSTLKPQPKNSKGNNKKKVKVGLGTSTSTPISASC
ncbi:hypothetical protein PTKIN_Ptkin10aG0043500 [Pterospermum kingtungense]